MYRRFLIAAVTLLVGGAMLTASADVIWQDPFDDGANWSLTYLFATPNFDGTTTFAKDPQYQAQPGTALRMTTPELLPWYGDAWVTNRIDSVINGQSPYFARLRLYAETYSAPVLDPSYLVESKIIQTIDATTTPVELVTYFTDFTWASAPGGDLPGWVNFKYELVGPPSQEMEFTADHLSYSVVPEPGTLLIGSLLVGLSGWRFRRRRTAD